MIHNDIQNQLQLLIKTSAPPLIEVADHAVETPEWTPGQRIPAHVLASLPNGRFQAQVGDQILDLNLPRNTQPGESLELTYVSNTPRLTFALLSDVPVPSSLPLSSPVTMSDAAKFIGNLMQPESQRQPVVELSSKAVSTPVLSAPPLDIPAFAQALRSSVSQSGLFYESHQVQWLNGELNLAALKQEPQGQLPPIPQAVVAEPAPQAQQGGHAKPAIMDNPVASQSVSPSVPQPLLPLKQEVVNLPHAQSVSIDHPDKQVLLESVRPQTVPLIQQQLHALDARQVIWQGDVWPGQHMRWEIEEDPERQGAQQEAATAAWHTRLNLQLPSLGGVSAKLAFVNGAIQMDIAVEAESSAVLMRQKQNELTERFAASGLRLTGATIRHG